MRGFQRASLALLYLGAGLSITGCGDDARTGDDAALVQDLAVPIDLATAPPGDGAIVDLTTAGGDLTGVIFVDMAQPPCVNTATNCGSPGACVDCTGGVTGRACIVVGGAHKCGCDSAADCPAGNACDVAQHACTTSCNANQACNGGCCDGAKCRAGTDVALCGDSGGLCASCANAILGHACLATAGGGACGCGGANDCANQVQCLNSHCQVSCAMGSPCQSGCCSGAQNGLCQAGTTAAMCGANGVCVDCSQSAAGHACLPNKLTCGCARAADCAVGFACDVATGTCTQKCNANQPCNGGCCDGAACQPGAANSQCGLDGRMCAACANDKPTCEAGKCSDTCGANSAGTCDGGFCCKGGHCVSGLAADACGYTGACVDCAHASNGSHCRMNKASEYLCGCDAAADCGANQACDTTGGSGPAHACTGKCGAAGLTGCNGGCCSGNNGTCQLGMSGTACGSTGGMCADCGSACAGGTLCNGGSCGCTLTGGCMAQACGARSACSVANNRCCVPQAQPCNVDGDCCSNSCNAGKCTCVAAGASCQRNPALCCSAQCDGNGNCM